MNKAKLLLDIKSMELGIPVAGYFIATDGESSPQPYSLYLCKMELEQIFPRIKDSLQIRIKVYDKPWGRAKKFTFSLVRDGLCYKGEPITLEWVTKEFIGGNLPKTFYVDITPVK